MGPYILVLLLMMIQMALWVGGMWYLVSLADRYRLTRMHALWGLLGLPGILLGAAAIVWFARRRVDASETM